MRYTYKKDDHEGSPFHAITCDACGRTWKMDGEDDRIDRGEIQSVFRGYQLQHRLDCPKRFESPSLILNTDEGYEHNFAILTAHHYGIEVHTVRTLLEITRSKDLTTDCIERTISTNIDPGPDDFLSDLKTLANTYKQLAVVEKISRSINKKRSPINPHEVRELYQQNKRHSVLLLDDLKNVFRTNPLRQMKTK